MTTLEPASGGSLTPAPASPPESRASTWTRSVGLLGGPVLMLLALAAALVPVIGWLDRGFDLLDEGYYLLGYRHPHDVLLTLSHFHPLVAALTGGRAWPILFYRILALAVSIASSLFFAIRIFRFDREGTRLDGVSRCVSLAAFTAVGGLLCYTVGPRSLSYNGLSNACMLIEVGLALSLVSKRARAGRARWIIAAILGAVFGAHLAIKATSAGFMGVWLLCAGAFLGLGGPRRWIETLAGGIVGAAIFAAGFFALVVPYHAWWTGLSMARSAMSAQYSPAALAASSFAPLASQLELAGARLLLSMALAAAGVAVLRRGRTWLPWICFVLALFLTLSTALDSRMFSGFIRHGMDGGTPFAMLIALALAVWLAARIGRAPSQPAGAAGPGRAGLIPLLLPLPILAALGTNNALSIQILVHLAPWFAALWLLADDEALGRARGWVELVAVAAAIIAIVEIGGSQLTHPYRLPGGIAAQVESFSPRIEAGRGVTVDVNTRTLVEDTRDLLDRNGFRPGDPVLVFYDLPGLVYLVGGRSPMLPWFFSGSDSLACRAITLARDQLGRGRFFILTRARLSRPVAASLEAAALWSGTERIGTVKSQRFGDLEAFEHPAPPAP